MDHDSIEEKIKKNFSKSGRQDWEKAATKELAGKNPFETLSWSGKDGISFLPYYDAEDDAATRASARAQAADVRHTAHTWLNVPIIQGSAEDPMNNAALQHLLHGADGVLFDLRNSDALDLNRLTDNIKWPYCYVGFVVGDELRNVGAVAQLINARGSREDIHAGLFWESIPKSDFIQALYPVRASSKKFFPLGIWTESSSPAKELTDALVLGANAFEMHAEGGDAGEIFSSVCFSLASEVSLFESVAKFRALRILWTQVAKCYGIRGFRSADLFVHARVPDSPDGHYAPRENMLKGSFAAISAVLGGCDALSICSAGDDALFSRWSRNVSHILREESFLDTSPDPFLGSWAIDAITNELASNAWTAFQKKMAL